MIGLGDKVALALDSIRAHKLRAFLTVLGITMGVATLITVMTIVQGANLYVEQKIANLGTNVFQVGRLPFAVVDFTVLNRAQRNRLFYPADMEAVATNCPHCGYVGGALNASTSIHYLNHQLDDVAVYGHSPAMVEIDTRTVETGRYFTEVEDLHAAEVCLIGDHVVHEFFEGVSPIGRTIRAGGAEYTVIGTFEKIGSVLGRDQDNFIIIPLRTFLKDRGQRNSLTISVKTDGPNFRFRACTRRHASSSTRPTPRPAGQRG